MATRRCKRGRKKGTKSCRRKPGPKRSGRKKRRSSKKCKRGRKKGSSACRRKPGPKKGKSKKRKSSGMMRRKSSGMMRRRRKRRTARGNPFVSRVGSIPRPSAIQQATTRRGIGSGSPFF